MTVVHPFVHYQWNEIEHSNGSNAEVIKDVGDFMPIGGGMGTRIAFPGLTVRRILRIDYNIYFYIEDAVVVDSFTHTFKMPMRLMRSETPLIPGHPLVEYHPAGDIFKSYDIPREFRSIRVLQFIT